MNTVIRSADRLPSAAPAAILIALSLTLGVGSASAEAATNTKSSDPNEYIVTGHVKDLDGHAVAGATIEWGSDKELFARRQHAITDKDGAYRLIIKRPGRDDHFAASAAGFATQLRPSTFERGEQVRDFILRTMPMDEHVVAGVVVDEKDTPVAGARVEAFTPVKGFISSFSMPTGRDYFPGPDRVATTDAQGRFRIADLDSYEVQLSLQAKHRHVNDANYPVKEGVKITMRGSGKSGVIQGRIVDAATNKPPENVREIRIVPRYSTLSRTCSDDEGHFRLPGEATLGDASIVYVYAKGYAAAKYGIAALPSDSIEYKDINLTKGATLKGKLVDAATGQPIKNAALLYGVGERGSYIEWSDLKRYADGYHPLKFVQHVTSDDAGEFWCGEPNGARGMIIALIPGYQRLILKPDDREIDANTDELVIRLKRECVFTGIVRQDGKPVPNESVSVSGPPTKDPRQMHESVQTDAQGKYTYGSLPAGEYYIHGDSYTRVATVAEGETKTVNLGDDLGRIRIHGNALPESSIEAYPQFPWDYRRLATKANEAGEYEVPGLKPGKYRLRMYSGFQNGFRGPRDDIEVDVDHDGQEINLRH